MSETTTTQTTMPSVLADVPPEALTEQELGEQIARQTRLLGALRNPSLIAASAERIAACAREIAARTVVRCPACSSAAVEDDMLGTQRCGGCGAQFGAVDEQTYRQICPGGWSPDGGFENARYVDFTIAGEGTAPARRMHGWINRQDSRWVQIG